MAQIRDDASVYSDTQALERIINEFQTKVTELRYDGAELQFDGRRTTITLTDRVGYRDVIYKVKPRTGKVERSFA